MEVSSDWKSLFPISSVFKPPLLLTDSSSKPILGPLFFNPKPKTLSVLFSSPSLPNPPPFLQTHNLLSFLCLPLSNSHLLFFPTGPSSDRVSFLLLLSKLPVSTSRTMTFYTKVPGNNHNHSTVVGYLLASTLCSMHWFVVQEIHNFGKFPRVSCLGSKVFKTSSVVNACWSPHIPEESVVLLESGALFLFDLESCFRSRTSNSNTRFRGTKLPVSWDADADSDSGNRKWLSCEFSWHPRILIVARSDAVFVVDLRTANGGFLSAIGAISVRLHRDRLRVRDRSTEDGGDWCDPGMRDGSAEATSVACMRRREMVLQVFFGCSSGVLRLGFFSCLVREEILKDDLPEWIDWQLKKELALGFVILNKDLSAMLSESNEFGGFTLIRLMSSGKLESQSYCALWKLKELHTERLTEVLVSKLKKPCKGPREKESFSSESDEILCEKLKACGFSRLRSSPAVSVVFNDISLPASIHEFALRRLWGGLPMELLQLAYSNYSEFLEESVTTVKEPIRIVYSDTSTKSLPNSDDLDLQDSHIAVSSQESRSTRVLSTTYEEEQDQRTNLIREVTDSLEEANDSNEHDTDTTTHKDIGEDTFDADDQADQSSDNASQNTQNMK
nr:hypothetical protein CFP56_33219 [Quercus suber]